jgi:IS66 C-terminal element
LPAAGTTGGTDIRPPPRAPDHGHYEIASDGGAESWATLASLNQTAKLNDVEPFAYLRDVLERIVSGKTKANGLAALLPWGWKASQAQPAVNS